MDFNQVSLAEEIIKTHANGSAFLNIRQMAMILNRRKQTLYNQHSAGTLEVPAIKMKGGLRWHIDDVSNFVRSQRCQ